MNTPRFKPGQTVLCRKYWQGKLWSERPEIVVQDTPDLLALYLPSNTVINQPVSPNGSKADYLDRLNFSWTLIKAPWIGLRRLRLSIPGAFYSILLFWNEDNSLRAWYINLEEPIRRTPQGFEYIDLFLDILAEPDLSSWRWLDEDELKEAVEQDYISHKASDMLYSEGRKAIEWLRSGNSPFNEWETWRPDPTWQIPVLTENDI
jgi:predicted RNA-binding protein associated with RNAse of E/G family